MNTKRCKRWRAKRLDKEVNVVIDIIPRLKAKREDELITEKAELIFKGWYSDLPEDEREACRAKIPGVDRKLEALA